MYKLTYRWGHPLFIVAMVAFIAASIAPGWLLKDHHEAWAKVQLEIPIWMLVGGWLVLSVGATLFFKAARVQQIKIGVTILSLMAILAALSNMFSSDPWWLISDGVLRVDMIQLAAAVLGGFVTSLALCSVQEEHSTVLHKHGHRATGDEPVAAEPQAEQAPATGEMQIPQLVPTPAVQPAQPIPPGEAESGEPAPKITRESRVPPTSTVTGLKAMSSGLGGSGLAARAAASGSATNLKGLLDKLDPDVKLTIPPDSGVVENAAAPASTASASPAAAKPATSELSTLASAKPTATPISAFAEAPSVKSDASVQSAAEVVNPTPTNPTSTAANLPEQKKPPASTTATRLQAQKRKSTATFTKLQALSAGGGGGTSAPRPKQPDSDQESDSLKSILDRLDTQPFDDEPVNDILSPSESLLTPPEVGEANRMSPPPSKQPEPPKTGAAKPAAKAAEPTKSQPAKKESPKTPEPSKKSEPAKPAAAKLEPPKTPVKPEPMKADASKQAPAAKKSESAAPPKMVHIPNDDETNLSAMLDNMESLLPESTDFSPPSASESPDALDSPSGYTKDDLLSIPTPKAKPGLREMASKEGNRSKSSLIKGKSDASKSDSEAADKAEPTKTEQEEAKAESEKSETAEAMTEPEKSETAETKSESEKSETAEAKIESEKSETAEATAEPAKSETAEATAEPEKSETAEAKSESAKSETAEATAEPAKSESAEAETESAKSESAEAKTESAKSETAEATAEPAKSESAEAETESAKSESAEAKIESEKSETAEAKSEPEKSETAEAKTEPTTSETAEAKTELEKSETAEAKSEPEKSETAEAKTEPVTSETAEAKSEPVTSETSEAKSEQPQSETPEAKATIEEAQTEPTEDRKKEEPAKGSIADAFAPEPASDEESALIAEAANILAHHEKTEAVAPASEAKGEPAESKTETAAPEAQTETSTEPAEAKTETTTESKAEETAPEAKFEAPEQKAEPAETKPVAEEKLETATIEAKVEVAEPTLETTVSEATPEPAASEATKPAAEAVPVEAETKAESKPEVETQPVEAASKVEAAPPAMQDNLFGGKVDQDIDDIFSSIAPADAQKEVGSKAAEELEVAEKAVSDSFIEIERTDTPPDASDNVFGQAIDKDIDDIFSNIVPVEAQKEVKDTAYQKPYGADSKPDEPAAAAAATASAKEPKVEAKPGQPEPVSPAETKQAEPATTEAKPTPVAAKSAEEIAAALKAQADTIPPVEPVAADNKLFEPQEVEKDLDDIFSNIAPEEAHQTVSDETLAKLKGTEEGEMSFEPGLSREERIAQAAKQQPQTTKFNETLARLPSMQGTVEGLLNNLADMADTDFKPESKKPDEADRALKPESNDAPTSKAVATSSVQNLLDSLEQENKEHAAQASSDSVAEPVAAEQAPSAPSTAPTMKSESESESLTSAFEAAQNAQAASAPQQSVSASNAAEPVASTTAEAYSEGIKVKAEEEAARQKADAEGEEQSEEGELQEGDVPLSMRSTVDIATALKDAQKAKQMAAVEKQLKEFGRLSTKAPTPSNEPPGSMKTIGKLLVEVSQIENIIKAGESGKIGGNLTTARVISAARGAGIKELLNKIDSYSGVKGSVIVGHDGLVIASTVGEDMDKDALGALSLHCLGSSNMATQKLEIGKLRQMVLISGEKITVLTDVDVGILAVFMDNVRVDRIDGLITAIHDTIHG